MWSRFLLALAILTAVEGHSQTYPPKPVRVVVPSSPGGASDLIARILGTVLGERLGQSFVIENRVTSGGIVGPQQVAEPAPDGSPRLFTFDTFATNPYLFKGLKWDPVRDFAPLIQVCRYPQVLLVHPSLGVKTVRGFVGVGRGQ